MPPGIAHCPVLIVEDDADLREMMAQLLSLEGFQAAAVANGSEALQYLHNGHIKPDVILLDLMMPVMDGWEFRRKQQADPAFADVVLGLIGVAPPPLETGGPEMQIRELVVRQAHQSWPAAHVTGGHERCLLRGIQLGGVRRARLGQALVEIDEIAVSYSIREL